MWPLGVNFEGQKEVLGLWISENKRAKFWMGVLTELKTHGVQGLLIVCMDGLTGFPDTIRVVYLNTHVQLCIVHMVSNSTRFVSYKDLKNSTSALRQIYSAPGEEAGRTRWKRSENIEWQIPDDLPILRQSLGRPLQVL
jgi:transposase-like protein